MTAQDRQCSYANQHHREISFAHKDLVFLKVSPTKGGVRFEQWRKLSPKYIGLFEVLEWVRWPTNLLFYQIFQQFIQCSMCPCWRGMCYRGTRCHARPFVWQGSNLDLRVSIEDFSSQRGISCKGIVPKQGVEGTTWEHEGEIRLVSQNSSLRMSMPWGSSFFYVILASLSFACVPPWLTSRTEFS